MKQLLTATLAAATLTAAASALADRPGNGWIDIEQAIQHAKEAGYTQLFSIEADDSGYWEGEGLKKDGKVYEFRVDGQSGKIVRDQLD